MRMSSKQVNFHIGMGKVASTYLQYRFFPKLKGVHYIQRTSYKKHHQIIQSTHATRYFVSNEFDRQLVSEVEKIAANYPDAGIIILLRRHDSWIASQYRRYVKNGGYYTFEEFIDMEQDKGYWKQEDLLFYPRLEKISHLFSRAPLVLFHDQLKRDAFAVFDRIAAYVGASYNRSDISLSPFHRSYSEKQLKAIRKFKFFKEAPSRHPNIVVHRIKRYARFLLSYAILYPSALLPDSWFGDQPLIDPKSLEVIRDLYRQDWQACEEFARQHATA